MSLRLPSIFYPIERSLREALRGEFGPCIAQHLFICPPGK
jgi:hypothetical protein